VISSAAGAISCASGSGCCSTSAKDAFPVRTDFFWNFDFDMDYLLSYEIDMEKRAARKGQRAFDVSM